MVICLERGADLHIAQLMPLPLTGSCFGKNQIGFIIMVPAHPGRPGKGAVKCVCVCVCVLVCVLDSNDELIASRLLVSLLSLRHVAVAARLTAAEGALARRRHPHPTEIFSKKHFTTDERKSNRIRDDPSSPLDLGIHESRDLARNRPLWRLVF